MRIHRLAHGRQEDVPAEAFALIGGGELVLQLKGQDRIEVAFGEGALSEDIVGLLSFIVSATNGVDMLGGPRSVAAI